jgi:hypothetical protein
MTTPSTPAPCGHCGSVDVTVELVSTGQSWHQFAGFCWKCDATGPRHATTAEALAAWNHRPREEAAFERGIKAGLSAAAKILRQAPTYTMSHDADPVHWMAGIIEARAVDGAIADDTREAMETKR